MRREEGNGRGAVRTGADFSATIATVLRRENQFLLQTIEVAFGPSIVGALLEHHELFGGKERALFGLVDPHPVLVELIPAVLCNEQPTIAVDCYAFAVTNTGGVPFGGRESLVQRIGVVAPDSTASLPLDAGLPALGQGSTILLFTRVGRGPQIHE